VTRYNLLKYIVFLLIGFPAFSFCNPVSAAETGEFRIQDGDGNVLIGSEQIRSYDWPTHTLTLQPQVRGAFVEKLREGQHIVSGVPFAVVVGNATIYTGNFTSRVSSRSFSTPVILADIYPFNPNLHEDQLQIQLAYPTAEFSDGKDPRADERVHAALAAADKLADHSAERIAWVTTSLREMQSIKPGMIHADLLKAFEEEGGLSIRTARRYVYRDCPYFKVNVKFDAVGTPMGDFDETPDDRITQISQPFLEWSIMD
jgi:hypothetical protein